MQLMAMAEYQANEMDLPQTIIFTLNKWKKSLLIMIVETAKYENISWQYF